MTVREAIAELQKLPNQDLPLLIDVGGYEECNLVDADMFDLIDVYKRYGDWSAGPVPRHLKNDKATTDVGEAYQIR